MLGKYALFLGLIIPLIANAQEADAFLIKGSVMDCNSGLPVSGANIVLQGEDKYAVTDDHGFFQFRGVYKGLYSLSISSIGFEKELKTVVLHTDTSMRFCLNPQNTLLHGINVIGHQPPRSTSKVNTLDEEKLKESRGALLGEILKTIPGVNGFQTGSTIVKPVIHGMHSNRILIINNGIKQEGQQWGAEHAPEIDPFIASTIQVIKGAEAVRYGAEAIGGIVLVDPPPLPLETNLSGSLNLVGNSNGRGGVGSAMLEGSIKQLPQLAWRVQGTFKKTGNIHTADYYLSNTATSELNYSAALSYRKHFGVIDVYYSHFNTNLGIFSGAHIGSLEDLKTSRKNGRPFADGEFDYHIDVPRQKVIHDLFKIKGHKDFENGAQITFQYGFQRNTRQEFDIRRGGRSVVPALNLQLNSHDVSFSYEKNKAKRYRTILGIDASTVVNNSIPGTFATPLIPNYERYQIGLFSLYRIVKEHYEIEGGLRYDFQKIDAAGYDKNKELYGGIHIFNNVSGSLGIFWKASHAVTLHSNLGLAWRPPSVNERYSNGLHHGSATIEIGDNTLNTEQGYKWINTLSIRKKAFQLELDMYGHILKNYIYLSPSGNFEESLRGAFPVFNYQQTDALFLGMDAMVSYLITPRLTYEIKGSFLRASDVSHKRYLPMIPSDRIGNQLRWEGNQENSVLGKAFLQVQYETVFKQTRYEKESDFAPPPESYSLINISAGTSFPLKGKQAGVNVSIDNLLNTSYKEYMNRFRYYAHDLGRNFTIRLFYKF